MNGQSKKQQELEAKRQTILKEIQQINNLIATQKKRREDHYFYGGRFELQGQCPKESD